MKERKKSKDGTNMAKARTKQSIANYVSEGNPITEKEIQAAQGDAYNPSEHVAEVPEEKVENNQLPAGGA